MTAIAILTIAGVLLIFAETLAMCGAFFAAGALAFAGAAAAAFFEFGAWALAGVGAAFLLSCALALVFWSKIIPKTRFSREIYLKSSESGKSPARDTAGLVGREGLAKTPLCPSGVVEVGGGLFDASCEDGHCEVGEKVCVASSSPFGLKVRKIRKNL